MHLHSLFKCECGSVEETIKGGATLRFQGLFLQLSNWENVLFGALVGLLVGFLEASVGPCGKGQRKLIL